MTWNGIDYYVETKLIDVPGAIHIIEKKIIGIEFDYLDFIMHTQFNEFQIWLS